MVCFCHSRVLLWITKIMRALIVGTVLGLLAFSVITPPASAQEPQRLPKVLKGQPAKDLKPSGGQVTTITSYTAQRDGGGGPVTNCLVQCFNGTELQWQCPHEPAAIAVHCLPHCSPPPAEGLCIYE
jgi:hypothetical protein